MTWHLPIPKRLHLYWDSGPIDWLRWQTVVTFAKLNPDWSIIFHRPAKPYTGTRDWVTGENKYIYDGPDHFNPSLVQITGSIKFPTSLSPIHRSDLLRWKLLADEGGVWADMDIIWTKPMAAMECNHPDNKAKEYFCYFGKFNQHRIGLLMSAGKSDLFKAVYQDACTVSAFKEIDYQAIGSALLNWRQLPPSHFNISRETVYPLMPEQIFDYSGYLLDLPAKTIGVHWFAGHPLAAKYIQGKGTKCLINKLV